MGQINYLRESLLMDLSEAPDYKYIRLLSNYVLTSEQKKIIASRLGKDPNLGKSIDWNNKNLTWNDFENYLSDPSNFSKRRLEKERKKAQSDQQDDPDAEPFEGNFSISKFESMPGQKLLLKKDGAYLFKITGYEASEYIGRNYEEIDNPKYIGHNMSYYWCISALSAMFDKYRSTDDIYFMYDPSIEFPNNKLLLTRPREKKHRPRFWNQANMAIGKPEETNAAKKSYTKDSVAAKNKMISMINEFIKKANANLSNY